MLAVISTHPIQYHAPVYRAVQQQYGVPTTAIYDSDFSLTGYHDAGFNVQFAWDTDLLSGYTSVFLRRTKGGQTERGKAFSLKRILMKLSPRAVLLTGYSPCFHQLAFYHSWRLRRPILFRGETNDRVGSRSALKSHLRRLVLRGFYKRCSRLLYVGRRSYEHFRSLRCPDEKLLFSPYCVDESSFQCTESDRAHLRSEARRELAVTEQQTVLMASGKLIPRKAPDRLLHAAKLLASSGHRDLVVVFLGDGELKNQLNQLAREASPIDVRFLGFKNQTQLSRYYHAADLLVLPSLAETWGLVVNEALLHGLPTVVSDGVGCGPDLIETGVTGEVCKAGSPPSLAAAIQRALPLARRSQIRTECRRTVGRYGVEQAARSIAEAYRAATEDATTSSVSYRAAEL